jgi:hypothetical protein
VLAATTDEEDRRRSVEALHGWEGVRGVAQLTKKNVKAPIEWGGSPRMRRRSDEWGGVPVVR